MECDEQPTKSFKMSEKCYKLLLDCSLTDLIKKSLGLMEKTKRARLQPFLPKGGARWVAEMSTNAIQTNILFEEGDLIYDF